MFKNAAIALDLCAAEILPIAIGSEVHNAQVHSQNPFRIHRFLRFHITGHEQTKLAFDIAQVTFPPLTAQQFKLSLSSQEEDTLTTVHYPDRDFFSLEVAGENSIVKSNGSMWFERAFGLAVNLVGVGDFGKTADNDLSGQRKPIPHVSIGQFVEWELSKGFMLSCLMTHEIARSVCHLQRFAKCPRLFGRREEFHLRSEFHRTSVLSFL